MTQPQVRGNIDRIERFKNFLAIDGWALYDGFSRDIQLFLNGKLSDCRIFPVPRPDLDEHFPSTPNAYSGGFRCEVVLDTSQQCLDIDIEIVALVNGCAKGKIRSFSTATTSLPYLVDVGICPICGPSYFIREAPWLRDHYVCDRCRSIPRFRALVKVLNDEFPDWRDL